MGNTRKPSGEEQGVFIQGDKGGLQQNPPETQICLCAWGGCVP